MNLSILHQTWRNRALCAEIGPDLFFPDKNQVPREAKKVCDACEVSAECLTHALVAFENEGVWGGTSPKERVNIRLRADRNLGA